MGARIPAGGGRSGGARSGRIAPVPQGPAPASFRSHWIVKLVEVVPNFSEGRRPEVVERLADAVRATTRVLLLDQTSDPSHNRSVLTFAGPPEGATEAMERAVGVAIREIDMEAHQGEHPRI